MFHRGQWRMALCFAFNGSLNERIKQIGGRCSSSKKCWYLNDDLALYSKLKGIEDVVLWRPRSGQKAIQRPNTIRAPPGRAFRSKSSAPLSEP